jgi:L-fuconolactonase
MIRIDSHHHFWDPGRATYPWMTDDLAPIRRPFGPADLRPLIDGMRISRTILVQTRSSTEETEEFLATAAAERFIAGVVGWVDLTDPAVADEIARLRAAPGGDRLVGVRHQVQDEPDPEWLARPDVRRGLAAVASAGLAYDLLVRPRELPAAFDAAAALPDLRFVVDHIGKPRIAAAEMEPWASRIRSMAELPNVACKLSGMVTEADWRSWTTVDLHPYVDAVLEAFGAERLLFGSDWPVCLMAASYDRVVGADRELLAALSDRERARIFGETAAEVYRLDAG